MAMVEKNKSLVQVTVIYIEDDDDRRRGIESFILRLSGLTFRRFISVASIEEMQHELDTIVGPLVIIMDLRLGNDESNFNGYHWIMEEYEDFLHKNADTSIFVLSAELNAGIEESLVRRHIPKEHIFPKDQWDHDRHRFLELLRNSVEQIGETTRNNILEGRSGSRIDPYLVHTFRTHMDDELDSGKEDDDVSYEDLVIPMLIRVKDADWNYHSIPDIEVLDQIDNIFACRGTLHTMAALETDPVVEKVEASRPSMELESLGSLSFVKADTVHYSYKEKGDHAIVAIIDDGINIRHEAFLDASGTKTRILAIWDQTDQTGPAPAPYKQGTEYTHNEINKFIRSSPIPPGLARHLGAHGTHVASIAAGRPTKNGLFGGGVAPDAHIIVVIPDLGTPPDHPDGLGYEFSHLMALNYIKNVAAREGLPVVIQLSRGLNAGPHDGTSSIEMIFDKITGSGKESGIAVVKSAGNERTTAGHAKITLMRDSAEVLCWESQHDHRKMDVVELWFKSGDKYRFRLKNPSGDATRLITSTHPTRRGKFLSGNYYQIDLVKSDPSNGDSQLMIRIECGSLPSVQAGIWQLEIEGLTVTSGEIHAWLEWNSIRPTHFLNHVDESMTLSIPGTAHHVITVGSVELAKPYKPAATSSCGTTRDGRYKPDLAAPGEGITVATIGSGDNVTLDSGTSIAAPYVAGAIALLMSYRAKQRANALNMQNSSALQVTAAQIGASITQHTQNYDGKWHPAMGYGILDVAALLQELGKP